MTGPQFGAVDPARAESAASIDEVIALYERFGREHYDEELGQLDHALQTAALAVAEGAPDALVAAALLHDVGHLLDLARVQTRADRSAPGLAGARPAGPQPESSRTDSSPTGTAPTGTAPTGTAPTGSGSTEGDLAHEAVGARYLAGLFPPSVTGPIALHVRAKRYRCAIDPAYRETLSDGSQRSLVRQGGPMSVEEVRVFERNPAGRDAVRLRVWDDGGKVDGLAVEPLEHYRELLQRVSFL